MEEVEIYIPKGNVNDDPNLMVGINGVNYLLPKGRKSKVPEAVAWEIERAGKAQEIADAHIDAMVSKAAAEALKI